jgi:hypothetical protein
LARDASRDTQAGTENAANGMRLHFDSMLTAHLRGTNVYTSQECPRAEGAKVVSPAPRRGE